MEMMLTPCFREGVGEIENIWMGRLRPSEVMDPNALRYVDYVYVILCTRAYTSRVTHAHQAQYSHITTRTRS